MDGIRNLMDLPKLMFMDEEYGGLKVVADGGQFTRNNNRKGKAEVLQVHSVTNAIGKIELGMVCLAVTFFVGRQ